MNPAVNEKDDDQANIKKAQRKKENAERKADEHWKHRSPGYDLDDETGNSREREGTSPLGKGVLMSSEPRQKDTGNIG